MKNNKDKAALNAREEKVLIMLMTVHNSEKPMKLGIICKTVGLHPVYATVLNKNNFFIKSTGGKFSWNPDKPRPNPYMVNAVIDEVKKYQRSANVRHKINIKGNEKPIKEIKVISFWSRLKNFFKINK